MKKNSKTHERLQALADALKRDSRADLSCEELQGLLPAYVEAEMEGKDVKADFPAVWRHVIVCEACGALYADLLEVSMLEEAGQLPIPATLPAPDLSFLPAPAKSPRELVERIARGILERMDPGALEEFPAFCETFFERVQEFGGSFRIASASELALAFGSEVSSTLPILAATFATTTAVLEELAAESSQSRRSDIQRARLIERTARKEARRLGLSRSVIRAFAVQYLQVARDHLPTKDE